MKLGIQASNQGNTLSTIKGKAYGGKERTFLSTFDGKHGTDIENLTLA